MALLVTSADTEAGDAEIFGKVPNHKENKSRICNQADDQGDPNNDGRLFGRSLDNRMHAEERKICIEGSKDAQHPDPIP